MNEKITKFENSGLLDMKQAAAFLNIKISTLYQACMKRQISYHKVGKLNRFMLRDLQEFLDRVRREAIE